MIKCTFSIITRPLFTVVFNFGNQLDQPTTVVTTITARVEVSKPFSLPITPLPVVVEKKMKTIQLSVQLVSNGD